MGEVHETPALPSEAIGNGRKYQVGEVVARGGIGAILSARDVNCRP